MVRLFLLGLAAGLLGAALELGLGLAPGVVLVPLALHLVGAAWIVSTDVWRQGPRHWADWPSLVVWPVALPLVALWVLLAEILWPRLREDLLGFGRVLGAIVALGAVTLAGILP